MLGQPTPSAERETPPPAAVVPTARPRVDRAPAQELSGAGDERAFPGAVANVYFLSLSG